MKKIFMGAATVVLGAATMWFFMPPYTRLWQFPADWWRVVGIMAGALFIIGGGTWLVLLAWEKHVEKYNQKYGW